MGAALGNIDVEVDIREHRVIDFREHRGVHLEHGGAGTRVLTTHDAQQGIALGSVRALIHDGECLAIAHVNGLRIFEDPGESQAIQRRVAVKALVDLHSDHGPAAAIGRQGIELAGTAVGAIAVCEFAAVKRPLGF